MSKIKVNDLVKVICGKDKGKTGKVVRVYHNSNRALVEGVNVVKKSLKPNQQNPTGGFVEKENSIHLSNIMLSSPKNGKPSRIGFLLTDGKKSRVAKACGSLLK
jgi:large subunit ribosomal protein L24